MSEAKEAFLCRWIPREHGYRVTERFEVVVIAGGAAEAASIVTPNGPGELVITGYPLRNLPDPAALPVNIKYLVAELQAMGDEFGLLGGERLTDGLRRVLVAQRDTIANLNAVCERYEAGFTDPGRRLDEIRDVLGRRKYDEGQALTPTDDDLLPPKDGRDDG